jgi:hypothetical protein
MGPINLVCAWDVCSCDEGTGLERVAEIVKGDVSGRESQLWERYGLLREKCDPACLDWRMASSLHTFPKRNW